MRPKVVSILVFTAYVEPIGGGVFIFLLVALAAALPYVVWQYRRRGRVSPRRVLAESLFGLYLVCAWALVLMPFPQSDAAACARGTGVNTEPFVWVGETAQVWEANGGGWRGLLGAAPLVIRVFNVALTIPLGVFARRWFRWSLPWTVAAGLALSLAFELTQVTGNWWLYECPYRSFDVDDLIANTAGAGIGWLLAPAMFFVPHRSEADDARAHDPVASVPRRAVALVVDVIGWLGTTVVLYLAAVVVLGLLGWPTEAPRVALGAVVAGWLLGQVVLPWLASGSTLGTAAVGLRIQRLDGSRPGPVRLLGRFVVTFGVFAVGTVLFALPEVVAPALWALLAGVAWWLLLAVLAAPRADNATLGDLATGTRVVTGNPPDAPLPGRSEREASAIPA